nr:uncharacterized protein CFAP97D2 [Vanessa tameamea]
MLSRREKLLVQPWEDRRYKDHRQKVRGARAAVDAAAPPARPHVALKLKKCQRERERRDKLCADNFSLLQRLAHVMAVNRLDNHWDRPLPEYVCITIAYYFICTVTTLARRNGLD